MGSRQDPKVQKAFLEETYILRIRARNVVALLVDLFLKDPIREAHSGSRRIKRCMHSS
jgi:hypothetical protein